VTDLGAYRFVYTASTDGIVSVIPSCSPAALPTPNCESRADLLPVANGSTVLRVDVLGPGDELVATGSMAVTVARSDLPTAVSTTAPG
jgi:hypothetical protein